jgi:Ser/Thr protein kinase RdoA (MazF antagonist)
MHASTINANHKSPFLKIPFEKASYHSQIFRLRKLAEEALRNYSFKVKKIAFVNHGENTVFKVFSTNGKKFMLRIHRHNYHTEGAINEELAWLALLSKQKFLVPKPMKSKKGKYLLNLFHPYVGQARFCSLFDWIDGRFLNKTVSAKQLYQTGRLIAQLQLNTPKAKVNHRRYWTPEGLAGTPTTFGNLDDIPILTAQQQKLATRARKIVFKNLKAYRKKFPKRMGLIHADLHFGNAFFTSKGLAAIDFDDCGLGFHIYDLVVPFLSVSHDRDSKEKLNTYKKSLFEGYRSVKTLDEQDEKIFRHLLQARKLIMISWLYSRSDNPRLKKHFKKYAKNALKEVKQDYGL